MVPIFDRFTRKDEDDEPVDWVVLLAGMVLLAISVTLKFTGDAKSISGDSVERAAAQETERQG